MSNGSCNRSEESRPAQAPSRRPWLRLWFVWSLWPLIGCHHAISYEAPDLQAELAAVSTGDLLSLAASHARSGDLMRAEQYLSAAQQRGHENVEIAYWLVRVCVAAGRYQSALAHAIDYLRVQPTDWSLRLVVATLHEALGDTARAELELERIVTHLPEMALAHYRLAMLYHTRAVDRERARMHLEEYLRLAPAGRHAVEATATLSEMTESSIGPRPTPRWTTMDTNEEGDL